MIVFNIVIELDDIYCILYKLILLVNSNLGKKVLQNHCFFSSGVKTIVCGFVIRNTLKNYDYNNRH